MNKNVYGFLSDKERIRILAQLQIAVWMGLIASSELTAVEERRKQKNEEIKKKLANGEIVYGLTHYTPAMYLEYELTRFKLEYTVFKGKTVGTYPYPEITEKEKQDFYEKNRDLFTRYFGDSFAYDEVKMIIEKRLREQEYENMVEELSSRFEVAV